VPQVFLGSFYGGEEGGLECARSTHLRHHSPTSPHRETCFKALVMRRVALGLAVACPHPHILQPHSHTTLAVDSTQAWVDGGGLTTPPPSTPRTPPGPSFPAHTTLPPFPYIPVAFSDHVHTQHSLLLRK
jgi:hypothetical protein